MKKSLLSKESVPPSRGKSKDLLVRRSSPFRNAGPSSGGSMPSQSQNEDKLAQGGYKRAKSMYVCVYVYVFITTYVLYVGLQFVNYCQVILSK